jgi:hypothetical protein
MPGPNTEVRVEFEDESGKLSLPMLDFAGLTQLFVAWEVPKAEAEKLADALLGWMRAGLRALLRKRTATGGL